MEKAYSALKDFILNEVNAVLSDFETEECTLPEIKENAVYLGEVDMIKNTSQVLVSIWPETSTFEAENIDGDEAAEHAVTVTFICRARTVEEMIRRSIRYAEIFRQCAAEDYSLDGKVEDAAVEKATYYPDAGTAERQASAVELEMTIKV